jgi:hypothetical protein
MPSAVGGLVYCVSSMAGERVPPHSHQTRSLDFLYQTVRGRRRRRRRRRRRIL